MKPKSKTTLYCFSPPVMIATMVIELALAIFTFVRIKKSAIKNIAVITLVLLAVFQLAEFLVCQAYSGINSLLVSRAGFVAVTFLPPLGIHTANVIAGRKHNWSTYASYTLALGFSIYFLLVTNSVNQSICSGNYVIFHLGNVASMIYGIYYFSLLGGLLALTVYLATIQKSSKKRQAMWWLTIGALAFLIPTGIVYFSGSQAASAIPSVMCGFAVIYAIVLALRVVPLASAEK
jgi:hypothetical protein